MRGILWFFCLLFIPMLAIADPVVSIVTVDRMAYEDGSFPRWGIETPQTPSRKAAFQVWRTGSVARPLAVNYRVSGSASNGLDYERLSGQITIPAGSRFARIIVHPIDDDEVERRIAGPNMVANETVVLTLQPSRTYQLSFLRQARAFIVDEDLPPIIIQPVGTPMPQPRPIDGSVSADVARDQRDNTDYLRYIIGPGPDPNRYRPAPRRLPPELYPPAPAPQP